MNDYEKHYQYASMRGFCQASSDKPGVGRFAVLKVATLSGKGRFQLDDHFADRVES